MDSAVLLQTLLLPRTVLLMACRAMQKYLGLGVLQRRMIRHIWREACQTLSRLREERAEILSRFGSIQSEALTQQFIASSDSQIAMLHNIAELSENARMQLEVKRSATRKFIVQVCSPIDFAKLVKFFWPIFPDLIPCIRALASS